MVLLMSLGIPAAVFAQPRLSVTLAGTGSVRLSWEDASGVFVIEQTPALGVASAWQTVPNATVVQGASRRLTLPIPNEAR